MIRPLKLFVEYDPQPEALATPTPRFSWKLTADERGTMQSAYQLMVATDPRQLTAERGDLWDTGRVASAQSLHVRYAGLPLQSGQDYYWKLRVWDQRGQPSAFSAPARFSTALLAPDDWQARWIGRGPPDEIMARMDPFWDEKNLASLKALEPDPRAPLFRKEFSIDQPLLRARAFICGLGYYELRLNGRKVGDRILTPPKTDYRQQALYDVYDVTAQLVQGQNAVGIMLGNGWFNPQKTWWSWRMQWYGSPRVIFQLAIEYADGARDRVLSDATWQSVIGPISANCIYSGETYDARQEKPGWDCPGYNAAGWEAVNLMAAPGGKLVAAMLEPTLAHETIQPVALNEPRPGVYVYDLGQNFSGWVRLCVAGPRGTEVTLKFAEKRQPDGMIDMENLSLARPTDKYILKGEGREVYEPRFTWHGFRYVELTGYPGGPDLNAIAGRFIHSACALIGRFACGNELINRIHRCTVQTQRANLQGLPLDCPQRDERLGWLGDAHVTAEEAMLNLEMARLYTKWLRDIKAQQESNGLISMIAPRPGIEEDLPWSSAYFLIPWYMYVHYGDRGVLEEHYPALLRYLDYLQTQATGDIQKKARWGDHLSAAAGWEVAKGLPESISTAFYYLDVQIMMKIAAALGRLEEAQKYSRLSDKIKAAFNRRYFDSRTNRYDDGTQTALTLPLSFGLVPEEHAPAVFQALLDDILVKQAGHLTTGFVGTKYLMDTLTAKGRPDVAWQLATQTGYPSWSDMLSGDMTTIPESWDKYGSLNHPAMGSIDAWFYKTLAGINADERYPGYERIVIKPYVPADLDYVNAAVDTIRGLVAVNWRKADGVFRLEVAIPANSRGSVQLPVADGVIKESGQVIWRDGFQKGAPGIGAGCRAEDARGQGGIMFTIGPGTYLFECEKC